jgi:hypothetical protein
MWACSSTQEACSEHTQHLEASSLDWMQHRIRCSCNNNCKQSRCQCTMPVAAAEIAVCITAAHCKTTVLRV